MTMTWTRVHTWNESEVSDLLRDIGRAAGLIDGERVEIEAKDGQIDIRRAKKADIEESAEALAALEEIISDRKGRSLAGPSVREMIDEGRQ